MAVGIVTIEVAVAAGLFLLMASIVFGMMAGCATIQEFIHIFI
jgi:hypothetical protein